MHRSLPRMPFSPISPSTVWGLESHPRSRLMAASAPVMLVRRRQNIALRNAPHPPEHLPCFGACRASTVQCGHVLNLGSRHLHGPAKLPPDRSACKMSRAATIIPRRWTVEEGWGMAGTSAAGRKSTIRTIRSLPVFHTTSVIAPLAGQGKKAKLVPFFAINGEEKFSQALTSVLPVHSDKRTRHVTVLSRFAADRQNPPVGLGKLAPRSATPKKVGWGVWRRPHRHVPTQVRPLPIPKPAIQGSAPCQAQPLLDLDHHLRLDPLLPSSEEWHDMVCLCSASVRCRKT